MTNTNEQTLEAIRTWLTAQDSRLETTLAEAGVWSEAWSEAWGGQQVLRHLHNILENGSWNGEFYTPYE